MIKRAKNQLAERQITEFLEKMQLMGFEKRETLTLITKLLEEMKK
jgi:DNA-binding transcriptional regulator YhcF (GntR family)